MAELSKYQVYTDALRIVNAVLKSHRHFVREYRYTLGDSAVCKALDMLDSIGHGLTYYEKKKKLQHILDAIDLSQALESRLLLAADNNCMDDVHAGWYIDHLPKLRKQLERLANSLARQSGEATPSPEDL